MREQIREMLKEQAESAYRKFSAALVPGSKQLLGVRLPVLRKMAKEAVKGDWRAEVSDYDGEYEDLYFEETMLRGMLIGYGTAECEVREGLSYVAAFIPYIDNWSVCDSFCNSFLLADRHREEVWEFLQGYLYSEKEFKVRTAVITLLNHFLKYDGQGKKAARGKTVSMTDVRTDTSLENIGRFPYLAKILGVLNREYPQGYYAQMAAAWTAAESFVVFPYETMQILGDGCRMDTWTRRKALQKICESRNPDEEVKAYIRQIRDSL